MKKKVFLLIIAVLIAGIAILLNVANTVNPEISVEYINEEVLTGTEYVDEILSTSYGENYIVCLCAVFDEEFMFLVLKNDDEYSLHFRENFSVNVLSEDATKIKTDEMPLLWEDIKYNVFLNPSSDTVLIDGIERTINKTEYKGYNFGFWWFESHKK